MPRTAKSLFLLLLFVSLGGCELVDGKLLTACETVAKRRLASPSSYRRVEVVRSKDLLSRPEFIRALARTEPGESVRRFYLQNFDAGELSPTLFRLFISYDAENAFGAVVRGGFVCEYFSRRGEDGDASEFNVEIDGKDHADWMADQIRAATRK